MSYYIIGDLIHPDTLNLWLEDSGLARLTDVVFVRKDQDDWLAIVPAHPTGPALRRFRQHAGGWRHFPMKPWPKTIAPHSEVEGIPATLPPLAKIPTWTLYGALAADPRLVDRLKYLARCLDFISIFPGYSFLRERSAQLDLATKVHQRSSALHGILVLLHRIFSREIMSVEDVPSASQLLSGIDCVLTAISKFPIEFKLMPAVPQDRLNEGLIVFDDIQSHFIEGTHARTIAKAEHWDQQKKVILVPKLTRTSE